MASEIFLENLTASDVVYNLQRNAAGQAWNGTAFVSYAVTHGSSLLVRNRTTIGATGDYGPFDLVADASKLSIWVTTQSSGSETRALDNEIYREDFTVNQAVDELTSASSVSPFLVDDDSTWRFPNRSDLTSPQLVSAAIGDDDRLVQMDFSLVIPANGSLNSIGTVAFTNISGTEPTIVSSELSADRKKVHVKLDCSGATANT